MLKFALFSVAAMTAAALQPSMLHEQVREAVQTALQTPLLLKSVMSSLHQRRLDSPEPPPENIGDGDVACVRANNTLTALAGPRGTCPMPDALNSTRDELDIFCSSNCAENISVAIQSVSDNCALSEYNTNRFEKFHMLTNFICGKTSNEADAPYCFEGLNQSMTAAGKAMKKSADDLTALEREQAVNGLHSVCASACKTSIMTVIGKEKESAIDAVCATNPAGDYCIFDILAELQNLGSDFMEMMKTGMFCTDCFKRILPPLFALTPPSESVRNTMNVISGDLSCSRPNNGPSCMFRFATEIAKLEDEEGSDTTTIAPVEEGSDTTTSTPAPTTNAPTIAPEFTPGNCTSAYTKFLALAYSVDKCFDENATQCPAACQDPITAFVGACKDNVIKMSDGTILSSIAAEVVMSKTVFKNPVCVWTVEEGSDTTTSTPAPTTNAPTIAPEIIPGNCTSAYTKFLALAFSVDFSVDCKNENATQCPAACQDPITAFVDACKDNLITGADGTILSSIAAEIIMGKTVVKNPVCVWTAGSSGDSSSGDSSSGDSSSGDGSSGDGSSGDSSSGDSSSGDSSSGDSSSGDSSSAPGGSSSADTGGGSSSGDTGGGSSSGAAGGGSSSGDTGGGSSSASSLKVTMCGIATHGECRAGHTQAGVDFRTGCNTETVTESCSNPASQLTHGMKLSAGASSDSATLEYYADANSNCTGTATYTLPINTTCSVQGPWALEICQQDCVNNTVNNSFNNASDNTATGENTTTGDNAPTRRRRLKALTNEELCLVAVTLQSCCAEMLSKFAEMQTHSFDARNCPNVPAQSCTNSWDSSVAITFPTGLRANIGSAFADEVTKATILEGIRNDIAIQLGVNVTTIDITSSSFDDATGLLSLDYIVVSGQDSYGLAANAKNNQLDLANMLGALSAEVPTLDLSGVDLNTIQSEFTGTDPGERPPNPTDSNNTISNVTVTSEPPNPTDSDNTVAGAAALAVAPLAIALSFVL